MHRRSALRDIGNYRRGLGEEQGGTALRAAPALQIKTPRADPHGRGSGIGPPQRALRRRASIPMLPRLNSQASEPGSGTLLGAKAS